MSTEAHRSPTTFAPHDELDDVDLVDQAGFSDDISRGIDWSELLASAQEDFAARRFRFVSTCEDPEEAMSALRAHLDGIVEEVLNEAVPTSGTDAARR